MTLKDILVISGQSGLFKYVSQGRKNIIIESLTDQKRTTIPATTKISILEEVSIFTENDNVPLRELLRKIQEKENGGVAIPHKSPDAVLKKYFAEVIPEYDKNRVYVSDIRKIMLWYNLLHELGITDFEAHEEEKTTEEAEKIGQYGETAEVNDTPETSENAS